MKKIIFTLLFSILNFSIAKADVKITKLKDNNHIFSLLKEYKIYKDDCKDLIDRYLVIEGIEYYDMNNNLKNDGVLVVLDVLSKNVVKIFEELKNIHFNINSIHPTSEYRKNLFNLIIEAPDDFNGTESFVCRKIEHSNKLSLHSFGTAIDINFLQNPCVFIDKKTLEIQNVVPKNGTKYLNRKLNRKNKKKQDIGKVNDKVVSIFKKYGYDIWGGDWDFPIDYQHFQVSTRSFADLLVFANFNDASKIIDIHTFCLNRKNKSLTEVANEKHINLLNKYKENKENFFKEIKSWCY